MKARALSPCPPPFYYLPAVPSLDLALAHGTPRPVRQRSRKPYGKSIQPLPLPAYQTRKAEKAPRPDRACLRLLSATSKLPHQEKGTYSNRSIGSDSCVLCILQRSPRIPHDTVNRERRQSHRRYALENGPLHHHTPEVLGGRNMSDLWFTILCLQRFPRICRPHGHYPRYARMLYALIVQVGLVAFVPYVSGKVCP